MQMDFWCDLVVQGLSDGSDPIRERLREAREAELPDVSCETSEELDETPPLDFF